MHFLAPLLLAAQLSEGGFPELEIHPISGDRFSFSEFQIVDVDKDGAKDLLSNSRSSVVSHLVQGDGIVSNRVVHNFESFEIGVSSLCDVDGDGDDDLVYGTQYIGSWGNPSNFVAWTENIGGGTFQGEYILLDSLMSFTNLITMDLENDGDVDIIVASYNSEGVYVISNQGGGLFSQAEELIRTKNYPTQIATEDLDNDGMPDLVVTSRGSTQPGNGLSWFKNLGNGSLGTETIISPAPLYYLDVTLDDFDADGDIDIAAIGYGIEIHTNDGSGVFTLHHTMAYSEIYLIEAADFNGDGVSDLVISQSNPNHYRMKWLPNMGDGTFGQEVLIDDNDSGFAMTVLDIDLDGNVDPVIHSVNEISLWYESHGNGTFSSERILSAQLTEIQNILVSDLTGDLLPDIVTCSWEDKAVLLYPQLPSGQFHQGIIIERHAYYENEYPMSICLADLDGDNDKDLAMVTALWGTNGVYWFENKGNGDFGQRNLISDQIDHGTSVLSFDLNGDSILDLVSLSRDDDKVAWYPNLGGGIFGGQVDLLIMQNGKTCIRFADLSGDGQLDLVCAAINDDSIAWYESLGGGNFGPPNWVTQAFDGVAGLRAGDLDQDGDIDIVGRSRSDSKVAWFPNQGFGQFGQEIVIHDRLTDVSSTSISDLDQDGDLDLIFGRGSGSAPVLFNNQGNGLFGPPIYIEQLGEGFINCELVCADLDNDNDLDVITSNGPGWKLTWVKNPVLPAFSISISNLIAGSNATLHASNATANGTVRAGYSLKGSGPSWTPFGDLLLSPPTYELPPMLADPDGNSETSVPIASGLSGISIWFHAFDVDSSCFSNGLSEVIQ